MTLSERIKKTAEFDSDGFKVWWLKETLKARSVRAVTPQMSAMFENARLRPILIELAELVPLVRHSCVCPKSSCLRKVLSYDEYQLDCNCGATEALAKLDSVLP